MRVPVPVSEPVSEHVSEPSARNLDRLGPLADDYKVCEKTLRRMVSRGELTGYRLGTTRVLLVDRNEVDRLLHAVPTAGGHNAAS